MMMRFAIFGFTALFSFAALAQLDDGQWGNSSQMGAEVLRLEEELRGLKGENERLNYQIQQMQESQKRFREDMEFRLSNPQGAISAMPSAAPALPTPTMPTAMPPAAPTMPTSVDIPMANPTAQVPYAVPALPAPAPVQAPVMPANDYVVPAYNTPERSGVTVPVVPSATPSANTSFEISPEPQTLRFPSATPTSPRELYNEAFRLLNQSDYAGAETAFKGFTQTYPNDPLIGNAWYWLGETFYVRSDYVNAADSFRQGFKALEEGPKAGDNLLKLAMSLSALEKDNESCVVLKQVDSKYSSNSKALKEKADKELKRLGC